MDLPFVDFYTRYNISPVQQDISDLEKHFQRRESLYRTLGIVPAFLEGKKIIEFGPGSGHNAIYTAHLKPSQYVLVDGNKLGINDCRENLEKTNIDFSNISFVHSLFQDYVSEEKYDLVLAENCIPHQSHPLTILKHLASFVRTGGIIVITSISAGSYLSETIRRLMRDVRLHPDSDPKDQLKELIPLIGPHLKTIQGMSRSCEDWILDNIVQPLYKVKLFSIPEAVNALKEDFDVYGTSPRFITDWRWYKVITGEERGFNEVAVDAYFRNNLNLLDYRYVFSPHRREFGEKLETMCNGTWDFMCRLEAGEQEGWEPFWELCNEIYAMINEPAPQTALALREAINWLKTSAEGASLTYFPFWWGRGSQYVSFIRR